MNKTLPICLLFILLCGFHVNYGNGLESAKQPTYYNPNTDFLAHEAGGNSAWGPKRDYVAPTDQNYNSQFPSLGASSISHTTPKPGGLLITPSKPTSGKRDYVAPQPQRSTTIPHGNQGTTAAQLSSTTSKTTSNRETLTFPKQPQPSGKRDYVAPQFTTQKPTSPASGKVKDLINFYDGSSKNQGGPQKNPSYSSIAQTNKGTSAPVTHTTQKTTAKPLSFSSIVAGSNKPTVPILPSTKRPTVPGGYTSTSRPLVLPSSLANNNRNGNQGNAPSDAEIQNLSEELLRKDTNNAAKYITINYQQRTTGDSTEDKAPQPFLTVAPAAWNIPTIQKLVPLLDNYERDTLVNEYVTPQERTEENVFMDVIMNTAVIRHLMAFLKDRGYVTPDPRQQRDFLKQLWFNLYSRGKGKISSSGFEHVFLSELKNGDVQGLHSWIYLSKEEAANRLNYYGYLKHEELGDKGAFAKIHFNQQGVLKPVNTLFIGLSPELDIALYTLCFVTRADNDCRLKLANKEINIITHTFRYRSKNYIGSAYPQI